MTLRRTGKATYVWGPADDDDVEVYLADCATHLKQKDRKVASDDLRRETKAALLQLRETVFHALYRPSSRQRFDRLAAKQATARADARAKTKIGAVCTTGRETVFIEVVLGKTTPELKVHLLTKTSITSI